MADLSQQRILDNFTRVYLNGIRDCGLCFDAIHMYRAYRRMCILPEACLDVGSLRAHIQYHWWSFCISAALMSMLRSPLGEAWHNFPLAEKLRDCTHGWYN